MSPDLSLNPNFIQPCYAIIYDLFTPLYFSTFLSIFCDLGDVVEIDLLFLQHSSNGASQGNPCGQDA